MTMLEDTNGNTSSKRVWGSVLLGIAVTMRVTLFILSIVRKIEDPTTAITASQTLLYTGGALLGLGVAENFGKK